MVTHDDDGVWMTFEETMALHHEEVFPCLTTEGGLMRWFCLSAHVDLRQGGTIVFGWDRTMERKSTVAILDYDPAGRIVWDWYADHGDMHAPVYWSVVPAVEQGCRVVFRQGPFRPTPEALMVMAEEAQTWRWHICNMRTALEAKLDMRKVRPL